MWIRVVAAFSLAVALATTITIQARSGADTSWDQVSVTRYLDARMDLWWERSKSLRTGTSEVKCISCHTAVPYAMVMPAIRRAGGIDTLTPQEQRILDVARTRITYGDTDQPYYDHTDDKKVESRGVEAVVNTFVLAGYDSGASPSAETRAAVARLWQVQRADGAWDWLNFGLEPYEAPDSVFYGATMAALAVGKGAGHTASNDATGRAGLEKLRSYLVREYPSQRLFNRTWALLASSRLDNILGSAQRAALLTELRTRQHADGGWSLADLGPWRWAAANTPYAPPGTPDAALLGESDGFATGFVVYALREAGVPVDDVSVARGQEWLRTHQVREAGEDAAWAPWRAHSLNHDREHGGPRGEIWRRNFMSDLATAFAALALL